jgi:hypothetical protein
MTEREIEDSIYEEMRRSGYWLGSRFQSMNEMWGPEFKAAIFSAMQRSYDKGRASVHQSEILF